MRCISIKQLRGRAVKSMIFPLFCKGSWVQSSATSIFFFHFSRFSLIPSQSASLYIIASFQVYLIAENNFPHKGLLVVLFQKFSTVQYILMPSISGMPLLYSISSLKSMTEMRGSSNFRLRGGGGGVGGGGGGGRTESDRKKDFVNFLVLKLIYSGFIVLNKLTVGSTVNIKENCTFWFQRGSNIFQGWGSTSIAYSL